MLENLDMGRMTLKLGSRRTVDLVADLNLHRTVMTTSVERLT